IDIEAYFELKDQTVFRPVFDQLVKVNAGNEKVQNQNYQGQTIYTFNEISWCFLKNYLILGRFESLKRVIDRADKPALGNMTAFQRTLKKFAPTGLGLLYLNLAPLVRSTNGMVKLVASAFLGGLPTQIAIFAGRDNEEVYVESSLPGTGSSAAL